MANTRLQYLYKKNVDNTCTEDEYIEFCQLVADDVNAAELEKLANAAWDEESGLYTLADNKADLLFVNIMQKGKAADVQQPKPLLGGWYKWAAVLLLMICAGVVLYNVGAKKTAENLVEVKANKEHQLIKLADGSTVVLNANSFLKYPKTFENKTREVTLIGEGYFDIKHKTSQPFIVHTGKLLVTVLGTAFNVKAYNQESSITVTVTRGKVSVSDEQKLLGVITPNQELAFNKDTQSAIQTSVNSDKTIEWQSRDMFFDDITMQQAAATLQQRFDVKINFASEAVKNCRFTGTFLHGEKLGDILKVICDFNNAAYKTVDEGHIVISGPGC